jgi:O-6-methylguanine DNA methyltransferase
VELYDGGLGEVLDVGFWVLGVSDGDGVGVGVGVMGSEIDIDKYGTEFQQAVWRALLQIPEGKVTSYGEVARVIGRPGAVRAVRSAVGKNPFAPEVPCHRVVPADGRIGHYSGGEGTSTKIALLKKEGVQVREGRIVDFQERLYRFPGSEKGEGVSR